MESCGFAFCAKFLVFLIIGVIISTCDATYYMKKDHSLIKPYAGIAIAVDGTEPFRSRGVRLKDADNANEGN